MIICNYLKKKIQEWRDWKRLKFIKSECERKEKEPIFFIERPEDWEFGFLDEKRYNTFPFSNYFLILDDLSINIKISLKWAKLGYFFLSELSKELLELEGPEYSFKELFSNSLNSKADIIIEEEKHRIFFNEIEIFSEKDILNFINKNRFYYDENSKILLKLKINLREFLILDNLFYPVLLKTFKYTDSTKNKI